MADAPRYETYPSSLKSAVSTFRPFWKETNSPKGFAVHSLIPKLLQKILQLGGFFITPGFDGLCCYGVFVIQIFNRRRTGANIGAEIAAIYFVQHCAHASEDHRSGFVLADFGAGGGNKIFLPFFRCTKVGF